MKVQFRRSIFVLGAAALISLAGALLWSPRPALAQAPEGTVASRADLATAGLVEDEANTVNVVAQRGGSVVAINVKVSGRRIDPFEGFPPDSLPPFFRQMIPQFRPQQSPPQQGTGSGFVVDEAGRIITNYHVVSRALVEGGTELLEGASITVTFPDVGTRDAAARVVGANALYDLALLELVNRTDLPTGVEPIPLADTSSLRPGQKAIAIGNPFGFTSTVTTGIVSATGRHFPGIGQADIPLIQTDAAINPGNSGGPLLNSRGEVIGVNTAIVPNISATGRAGFLGIGFAVPADILRDALPQLAGGGLTDLATRPRLGIEIVELSDYPAEVRQRLGLPSEGIGIVRVEAGSPAERAGLHGSPFSIQLDGQELPVPEDVIVAVDGKPITSTTTLQSYVFSKKEGDTVALRIKRNGQEITVEVRLATVPR